MSRSQQTREKERERRQAWKLRRNKSLSPISQNQLGDFEGCQVKYIGSEELGLRKLSDCLIELAEPFLSSVRSANAYRTMINFAVIAWNIANLPEMKRNETVAAVMCKLYPNVNSLIDSIRPGTGLPRIFSMVQSLDQDETAAFIDILRLLNGLIDRKLEVFAEDKRMIVDYTLEGPPEKATLRVTSVPIYIPNA
jgi:hypothetical protein